MSDLCNSVLGALVGITGKQHESLSLETFKALKIPLQARFMKLEHDSVDACCIRGLASMDWNARKWFYLSAFAGLYCVNHIC